MNHAVRLDPIATLKIEDLIRNLAKEYTIVIVTQNMQEAGPGYQIWLLS